MIFAYNKDRVIATDCVLMVPQCLAGYQKNCLQNCLHLKFRLYHREKFRNGTVLLHDNARSISLFIGKFSMKYGWEILSHLSYCSIFSSSNFHLFPKLKEAMRDHRFRNLEKLSCATTQRIRQINKKKELNGI